MYNYDFKDEKVTYEKLNAFVEIDDKEFDFNFLITDKHILLFDNINKDNILNHRGGYLPPQNELVLKIPIINSTYKIEENNTNITYENKSIIIYDFNLDNYTNTLEN